MRRPAESWTYGYDEGYRLTSSVRYTHPADHTEPADEQRWTYDVPGRITDNSVGRTASRRECEQTVSPEARSAMSLARW